MYQITLGDVRSVHQDSTTYGYFNEIAEKFADGDDSDILTVEKIAERVGMDHALCALLFAGIGINATIQDAGKIWSNLDAFKVWCARQVDPAFFDDAARRVIDIVERRASGLLEDGEGIRSMFAWEQSEQPILMRWMMQRSSDTDVVIGFVSQLNAQFDLWCRWEGKPCKSLREDQRDMFIKMCRGEAPWQDKE